MNLTLTQAYERTKDLSGALKAARAHEADCAADHEAKLRIAEIAAEAHEKATGHCLALEQEREELADHIAALVRRTGEPVEADGGTVLAPKPCEHANVLAGAGEPTRCADCGEPMGEGWYISANGPVPNVFAEPADFQAAALANGEAKMNQAFDEATR